MIEMLLQYEPVAIQLLRVVLLSVPTSGLVGPAVTQIILEV